MARYIDASELNTVLELLTKAFEEDGHYWVSIQTVIDSINKAPTADVVEVVRCKDCMHFTEGMAVGMCKRDKERPIIPVTYDHYCSYGKKVE
jgi:hypothetical protein